MMQVACSGRLCLRCLRRLRREPLFLSRSCSRFSSQAGSSASVKKSASTPGARGGGNKRLTAARSIEAFRAGSVPATGRFLHSAQDTNGLIDTILALLPDGPPGYVFFDLDETLITRDTCLVYGFDETTSQLAELRRKVGNSGVEEVMREMEREYYEAPPVLVDPLLARVIRSLKLSGHRVYGLTSNGLDSQHSVKVLSTLAQYRMRFSEPFIKGELPATGSVVIDHPIVRGVVYLDNMQRKDVDKGEAIADFISCCRSKKEAALTCVLIDNTRRKCNLASDSFLRLASKGMVLHCVHYTEAEMSLTPQEVREQFRRVLKKLNLPVENARGII